MPNLKSAFQWIWHLCKSFSKNIFYFSVFKNTFFVEKYKNVFYYISLNFSTWHTLRLNEEDNIIEKKNKFQRYQNINDLMIFQVFCFISFIIPKIWSFHSSNRFNNLCHFGFMSWKIIYVAFEQSGEKRRWFFEKKNIKSKNILFKWNVIWFCFKFHLIQFRFFLFLSQIDYSFFSQQLLWLKL